MQRKDSASMNSYYEILRKTKLTWMAHSHDYASVAGQYSEVEILPFHLILRWKYVPNCSLWRRNSCEPSCWRNRPSHHPQIHWTLCCTFFNPFQFSEEVGVSIIATKYLLASYLELKRRSRKAGRVGDVTSIYLRQSRNSVLLVHGSSLRLVSLERFAITWRLHILCRRWTSITQGNYRK